MAVFGTDGDSSSAAIAQPTPSAPTSPAIDAVGQDQLHLCGGQVSEAGTPTGVSVYVSGDGGASNFYIGVYKGSSATDPTGATLIGTTGNITATNGAAQWKDFALTSTSAFAANDYLWIGMLGRGTTPYFAFRNYSLNDKTAAYLGNWTNKTGGGSYDYRFKCTSVTGTSLPATVPAGSADAMVPFIAYITYTAGASAVKGRSLLLGVG